MRHRKARFLDGLWQFSFTEDEGSLPGEYPGFQPVPSCFDVSPEYAGRRGIGYYRTSIRTEGSCRYRLRAAIAHNGTVYYDDDEIASHHGAYTYFELDLAPHGETESELVISADNRLDGLNRPLHMQHMDWYHHGGIIRPVELIPYRESLIEQILPKMDDAAEGKVTLQVGFTHTELAASKLALKAWIGGHVVAETSVPSDAGVCEMQIAVPDPQLWSPDHPTIHPLVVQLGDDIVEMNLGLRTITSMGSEILLNGEPIAIKGINRHNHHMQFGAALPEAILWQDAMQIKRMGANFVRGSHYPQDPRFLDICDRVGLMVWSEATGWGYGPDMICDTRMIEAQTQCIREMIKQSSDHPCIVCWGFFNECASDRQECRPVYETMVRTLRELDPTRAVTYASNRIRKPGGGGEDDIMFDLVDWAGINCYPGWYTGELKDISEFLKYVADDFARRGLDKKPLIISEIGAGAIPGFTHQWPVKWSEDYQAELLDAVLGDLKGQDSFAGVCIWQYCDMLAEPSIQLFRPRGYNNKGIVDEYRRPKKAYDTVRNHFRSWK